MTSHRQQDLLEIVRSGPTRAVGDAWPVETANARLRLYWPVDVLNRNAGGDAELAHAAWAGAYEAGRAAFVAQSQQLASLSQINLARVREVLRISPHQGAAFAPLAGTVAEPIGRSLADWLATGATASPALVEGLAADLASGLEAAHQAGVLHLDVAPETVGISTGRAVLHDFSVDRRAFIPLVKRIDRLFRPGFSAFETKDATAAVALGPQADVYSLSAVIYRLIAGATPPEWFGWTETNRLSSLPEAAGHSAALVAAVERGLSRQPGDRFATVSDWAAAAALPLAPVQGRPWFAWPQDFSVPPSPAEHDRLVLKPAPVAEPQDPSNDLGLLGLSHAAPAPARRPMPTALIAGVAGLVLVVMLVGVGLIGRDAPSGAETQGAAAEAAPLPPAPVGCGWLRGQDEDAELGLRCGRNEAARRVDRGDLKPADPGDAAGGDPGAMMRLGAFYLRDTPARDESLGIDWLQRAAGQGEVPAMLALGGFYEHAKTIGGADGAAGLRQSLKWYQSAQTAGAGGGVRTATIDQTTLAGDAVRRIEARLAAAQDAPFTGCWRSAGREVTAAISIADDVFTLRIEGAEPASGPVATPREDGRLVVTLDSPELMAGQRYLFTRDGASLIEQRLDASNSTARWDACSAD